MRAWTLAGAWFLPNARDRDPAHPEPSLNQVLARYLVAACPGFPPGTAELAEPACAVCSPAMDPRSSGLSGTRATSCLLLEEPRPDLSRSTLARLSSSPQQCLPGQ